MSLRYIRERDVTGPSRRRTSYESRLKKGVSTKTKSRSLKKNYFKYHISAFPQHQYETIRFTSVTGTTALLANTYYEYPFVLNGVYDPDGGLSADQPAGFAKLMQVYTKCFVRAAKIRVTCFPVVAASYQPLVFGVTVTTNSTTLGSMRGAIQPGLNTYTGAMSEPKVIELDVDMRKFLGIKDGTDGQGAYNCTSAANPSQVVVGHVWVNNVGAVTMNWAWTVTVDFDCDFYDPVPVT